MPEAVGSEYSPPPVIVADHGPEFTSINVRPGELPGILEEDMDYERGLVFVRKHKTDRQTGQIRILPLNPEDLETIRKLPRGFPKMNCFRMDRGSDGRNAGSSFGGASL